MTLNLTAYKPTVGTTSDAAAISNAFTAIETEVNGGLKNANVASDAAIAVSKLAPGTDGQVLTTASGVPTWGSGLPTGAIVDYGAASAPSGWVLCDGASYLRSGAGMDALFAVIGTTYGAADGTHFNVPDLRGRVAVGYAASGGHTDVSTLANNDGVSLANRRAKHKHTVVASPLGHSHTPTEVNDIPNSGVSNAPSRTTGNSTETGGTAASVGASTNDPLDAPAYLVINKIIKT